MDGWMIEERCVEFKNNARMCLSINCSYLNQNQGFTLKICDVKIAVFISSGMRLFRISISTLTNGSFQKKRILSETLSDWLRSNTKKMTHDHCDFPS